MFGLTDREIIKIKDVLQTASSLEKAIIFWI